MGTLGDAHRRGSGTSFHRGRFLPFQPELTAEVIDKINLRADEAEVEIGEMLSKRGENADPEAIRRLSLTKVLKMSAPLFSEAWLEEESMLDPDDAEHPTLLNVDGDEIEFI